MPAAAACLAKHLYQLLLLPFLDNGHDAAKAAPATLQLHVQHFAALCLLNPGRVVTHHIGMAGYCSNGMHLLQGQEQGRHQGVGCLEQCTS